MLISVMNQQEDRVGTPFLGAVRISTNSTSYERLQRTLEQIQRKYNVLDLRDDNKRIHTDTPNTA